MRQVLLALSFCLPLLPLRGIAQTTGPAGSDTPRVKYAIAIHGGAGDWANLSLEKRNEILASLEKALATGRDILARGGGSLDAVEQTVRALEDAPSFNAGRGATFTATGQHQLDASIMSGVDRSAGAVAGVMTVKNPVSLARRVMTDTKHVLLAGDGAEAFARQIGVELVDPDYFWTEDTRREFEAAKAKAEAEAKAKADKSAAILPIDHYGTVGCVALDSHGNLAAATSTGGLAMKTFGRVGDVPLIGAGTYADNETCAVSGTGVGELFIRNAVCYDIAARMRYAGSDLADAALIQINERLPQATAGLIAVDAQGQVITAFNTAAMPRGVADSTGRFEVAIDAVAKQSSDDPQKSEK